MRLMSRVAACFFIFTHSLWGSLFGCLEDFLCRESLHKQLVSYVQANPSIAHLKVIDEFVKGGGFRNNIEELRELANRGCPAAQQRIVHMLFYGQFHHSAYCDGVDYGNVQVDFSEFRRLADKGWEDAQEYVADGLYEGCGGLKQDLVELRRLADKGWKPAQSRVAQGLFQGSFGFQYDPIELKKLADLKWKDAQFYFCHRLKRDRNNWELKALADQGWEDAQVCVAEGLYEGCYGFQKDHEELQRLADLGWTHAQKHVFKDLQTLYDESEHYPVELGELSVKLQKLADQGWEDAQEYLAKGLAEGCYGVKKDRKELIKRAIDVSQGRANPYIRYLTPQEFWDVFKKIVRSNTPKTEP